MDLDRLVRAIICVLGLGVLVIALPAAGPGPAQLAQAPAWRALNRDLAQLCPQKHLEWMPTDDAFEWADEFRHDKMSSRERHALTRVVKWDAEDDAPLACVHRDGLACDTNQMIIGFYRLSLTRRFAAYACNTLEYCKADADCIDPPQ